VWIPKSAAEVEEAARRGDLEETHVFDAKSVLPAPKKNHDLAVDVDAMTVDGGSLLYGLGEDRNKRLTVLSPVELVGAPERIAQIVETSISEPPFIRIQTLPLENDSSKGYVLVVVRQSPRAPHQVISGGDMRYYGRGAKGNRILSDAEVAALYARRDRWEVDREDLLRDELSSAPEADPPSPRLSVPVAVAVGANVPPRERRDILVQLQALRPGRPGIHGPSLVAAWCWCPAKKLPRPDRRHRGKKYRSGRWHYTHWLAGEQASKFRAHTDTPLRGTPCVERPVNAGRLAGWTFSRGKLAE
jgi:hypothetical protein